jgi:hypothetical protein
MYIFCFNSICRGSRGEKILFLDWTYKYKYFIYPRETFFRERAVIRPERTPFFCGTGRLFLAVTLTGAEKGKY